MTVPRAIEELEDALQSIRAAVAGAERLARKPGMDLMELVSTNASVAQLRQMDGEIARMIDQLRERALRGMLVVETLRKAIEDNRAQGRQ